MNTMFISVVKHMSDTTNKKLEILALEPREQRFIQLYLTGNFTITQLAQMLEVHPNTVHKWLKKPRIKNALVEAQGEIHEQVAMQIKAMTVKAVSRLNDIVDSPQDAVALQAIREVLDRGGHKTKNEIKVEKTVTTIEEKMKNIIDATIPDAELIEIVEDEENGE